MQEQSAARVARVSKVDAISVAGGLYQPVRRQLGVRAFAINAYFASSPGDQLIEAHDETGSGSDGHAELYLVVAGRASFVVGGSEIDAPAGTIVYIPAVETRREARALEDDTAAVVIGAPADRELPISPFEFWSRPKGRTTRATISARSRSSRRASLTGPTIRRCSTSLVATTPWRVRAMKRLHGSNARLRDRRTSGNGRVATAISTRSANRPGSRT